MAALAFLDRMNLNARQRRAASVAGLVVGVLLFVVLPIGLEAWVRVRRANYDELRTALASVQNARASVRERQAKKDAILSRYERRAPDLATYLSQVAAEQKLSITESRKGADTPYGKRYMERQNIIQIKKTGMLPLAMFLEAVEKSGFAVAVSRLSLRKRSGEKDQYDVEIGVSAYDRTEVASAEPAKTDGAKKDGEP